MMEGSGERHVLYVDADETPLLAGAGDRLSVTTAASADEGLTVLDDDCRVDCVVSAYRLPDEDGLTFFERVRGVRPNLPFVLAPRDGSEALATEAMRAGVTDYVPRWTEASSPGDRQEDFAARVVAAVERSTNANRPEADSVQAEVMLQSVVEHLPVGVLVEDASRTITAVNSALYDVFGLPGSGDDLLGLDCEEAAEATKALLANPDRFTDRIGELLDRREPVSGEALELADGRTLERSYVPYDLPDGEANLWLYRDVTARKRRERELTRERDRLDEFAGLLSHDLRNPLSIAEGNLELARDECDSDHLDEVQTALDRMEALVESVLALARQGAAVDRVEPVDLAPLVRASWDVVETGGAELRVDVPDELFADERRLRRLFENLFRNSVEHGATSRRSAADGECRAGDSVTVTVGTLEDGIYVEDDGPGIPPDERDSVFEPGYSTEGGTGFGLSIVRDIVEAHGWNVDVTAGEDGGARFEITGVRVE